MEPTRASVPNPALFNITGTDETDALACGKGMYRHIMGSYVSCYHLTALHTVYGLFNGIVKKYPDVAPTEVFFMEGYSQQAATRMPGEDSAPAWRGVPLLA
jgi:hypothetical protein